MHMKKILILTLAALSLFSCNKQGGPSTRPMISWEGNSSFAEQEIGSALDAKVAVSFPEGLGATGILQIKCSTVPAEIKGIISPWIGINANKATLILDLQADEKLASTFKSKGYASPVGDALKTATSCNIDFGKLAQDLTEGQVLAANSKFVFDLTLTDAKGISVNRSVKFRFTPAPTFPNDVPSAYVLEKNDTRTVEWKIDIPGKAEAFTIDFSGAKADNGILNYIKNRNDSKTTIDLIDNANVKAAFDLDPVSKGATSTTLKLTNLLKNLGYEASNGSSTTVTFRIVDQLGKESIHVLTLTVAPPK